jgi:hypothetical protein
MIRIFAETSETVTTGSLQTGIAGPMAIALVFGLAGTFFLGIYLLRRIRQTNANNIAG